MSKIATRAKKLYQAGALTREAVETMAEAGKITAEELEWILDD